MSARSNVFVSLLPRRGRFNFDDGGLSVKTTTRVLVLAATSAAAGAMSLAGATAALADDQPTIQQLGQQATLTDGGNVQGWTVTGLQPSADAIPYAPVGTLWEATATDEMIAGGALPFIPDFAARAANGDTYRVLWPVPTALGINPSGLSQGQSTTGKLYFDVTGATPDSVAYGNRFVWVQPPPGSGGSEAGTARSGAAESPTYSAPYTAPQTGSSGAASAAQPSTGSSSTGSAGTGTGSTAQAAPAQTAPTQTAPAPKAPAAAADDVHGSATTAQPTPSASSLDVHDTTAPATPAAPAPAAAPATTAPAPQSASAPAPAAASASAAPAPTAASAVPTTVVVPAPAASSGN